MSVQFSQPKLRVPSCWNVNSPGLISKGTSTSWKGQDDQEPRRAGPHRPEMQAMPTKVTILAGAPKCSVLTSVMTRKNLYLSSFWTWISA